MKPLSRLYLIFSASAFIWIGINTLRDPSAALAGLNLVPQSTSALSEIRANYGCMQIAIGLLLLLGAWRSLWMKTGLLVNIAITAGLATGRVISLWVDGTPNTLIYTLLSIETAAAIVGGWLMLGYSKHSARPRKDTLTSSPT